MIIGKECCGEVKGWYKLEHNSSIAELVETVCVSLYVAVNCNAFVYVYRLYVTKPSQTGATLRRESHSVPT